MATRSILISDISQKEIPDGQATVVQVKHPDNPSTLELDMSADEASKLVSTSLRLVEFTIREPGKPARTALVESKTLDKLFGASVDFDAVLAGARKANVSAPAKRTAAPKGDRVDYTTPENAGKLHRGRITEAEASWVKANQKQASYNREQQTGSPIDFDDPAEKKRYGIK